MSLVFIVAELTATPLPDLPWGFDRVFKYIGFYAIGCVMHEHSADDIIRKKIKSGTSGVVGMTVVAVILLTANFCLAFADLTTGVMWFVTALIGVAGLAVISIVIDHNRLLEYFGRISLVVLCVHGPVYRVIVKLVSIPAGISTDGVRENVILAMLVVVLTLAVCSVLYKVVVRVAPWMVGRARKDVYQILEK